jgi:hypothetical protein
MGLRVSSLLIWRNRQPRIKDALSQAGNTHLHLGIGPARYLNDHVEDGLLLIGIQRDIVEGRDGHAVLLNEDAVLECVRGANLARRVLAGALGADGSHV